MQDYSTQALSDDPPEADRPGALTPRWLSADEPHDRSMPSMETPDAQPASPWMAAYDQVPPSPPFGGDMPPGGRRRWPGRPRWRYALLAVALLVALGLGTGIGISIAGARTSSTTAHTLTIGAQSAPAVTVSSNVSSLQQTVEHVAQAVAPSVVEITSVAGGQEAIGSGDILTTTGYIVTNDHVVAGFASYTVTLSNGTKLQAQLVGEDPQDDLAVLKVTASNLQPIAFADSSQVTVGEFVVAVGNPLGLGESATFGTVSATNRTESESPGGPASVLTGLIQTSAPLEPGNSGGALVNLQGQLIGIPTLSASSQQGRSSSSTVGFAIPSNEVKTIAQQLIQSGHVTSSHGFLGIQGEDVTPALAATDGLSVQSGVLVTGFANDSAGQSPAQQAGLQTGDVITAVNGQAIGDSNDLAGAIAGRASGTQVTLTVVRGTSQLTFTVTLGARPANA